MASELESHTRSACPPSALAMTVPIRVASKTMLLGSGWFFARASSLAIDEFAVDDDVVLWSRYDAEALGVGKLASRERPQMVCSESTHWVFTERQRPGLQDDALLAAGVVAGEVGFWGRWSRSLVHPQWSC